MTRTSTGVGGEWRGLDQRSDRVRSIGEDPDQVTAQVWHEDICVRRVDDDLVRVAAVLARRDRPRLVDLWEDRLNRTSSRQSAVLTKLENADRARVAASCQRRFRGRNSFAAMDLLRRGNVGALAAFRGQDLGPDTARRPLDPGDSREGPIRRGRERVQGSDGSSTVVAVQNTVLFVEGQYRRVDLALLRD